MIIAIREIHEGINEIDHIVPSDNYAFPDRQFYPNPLQLNMFIDKLDNLFRFKISVSTKALWICDRCLESFERDFSETIEQIYQLGDSDLDDDDIRVLPDNSREIDLSEAIGESFILGRPIQLLCKENCMGLCANCGTNLNKKSCTCQRDEIDPRLEKLKSLLK
jgi:uncharacterized protein